MPTSARPFTVLMILAALVVAGCAGGASRADDAATSELRRRHSDEQVKTEVEKAADGVTYTSEADEPYSWVSAPLEGQESITEALVREKLASYFELTDGPIADQFAMHQKVAEFYGDPSDCEDNGSGDCAKIVNLVKVLQANLKGIKVYFFGGKGSAGQVDGTVVTIFVIGITPAGNIGGVKTIADWT